MDEAVMALARQVADRLAQVDGVMAVALGGSWARGQAHPGSDLDLGLYYHPERPPALAALRALAQQLDDRHLPDLVTDIGGWGPWVNGGGWLQIEGRPVDWLYRDLAHVRRVIDECRAGRTTCHYQPGHPHGFHTHSYLGEVHIAQPLADASGALAALKPLVAAYPPRLRRTLVDRYLWQADFALAVARKGAAREDVVHVAGCLFQCVAGLAQVLFALNEQYFLNEKGAVRAIETFAQAPPGFSDIVTAVLAEPGNHAEQLEASIALLAEQAAAVRALCAGLPAASPDVAATP